MKTKKYIAWQLKEWLPEIIAITSICFLITVYVVAVRITSFPSNSVDHLTKYTVWVHSPFTILEDVVIIAMILSSLFPLVVYRYRYNKNKLDFYKAVGTEERKIRRVRTLIGLSICIAITTLCFLFGFVYQIIEQSYYNSAVSDPSLEYHFQYGFYLLSFVYILLATAANYFMTLFFVSFAHNQANAVLLAIYGQSALFSLFDASIGVFIKHPPLMGNVSMIHPIQFILYVLERLTLNDSFPLSTLSTSVLFNAIPYFILAVLAFFYTWKKKEEKSEYAGISTIVTKEEHILIPILLFGNLGYYGSVFGIFYILALNIAAIISTLLTNSLTYFIFLLIYQRRVHFTKKILIPAICVIVLHLLISITSLLITLGSMPQEPV